MGREPFFPVMPVRADHGRNGIFVNKGLGSEDLTVAGFLFIAQGNGSLYGKRDLGIRDNRRKKERMGMSTGIAENPCNAKRDDLVSHPDFTEVSTIPDQGAGVSAGAGDLVEIKGMNGFIIKILRNRVAKIHFNGYHNKEHGLYHVIGVGGRVQTLVGENPAILLIVTISYDNTMDPRIKQSDGKYVRYFYSGTLFILQKTAEISLL